MGTLLVELGLLNHAQLCYGLQERQASGKRLGTVLVEAGFVDETQIVRAFVERLGFPRWQPDEVRSSPEARKILSRERAIEARALPLQRTVENGRNSVLIACADPLHARAAQLVRALSLDGIIVRWMVAEESELQLAIRTAYASSVACDGESDDEMFTVVLDASEWESWQHESTDVSERPAYTELRSRQGAFAPPLLDGIPTRELLPAASDGSTVTSSPASVHLNAAILPTDIPKVEVVLGEDAQRQREALEKLLSLDETNELLVRFADGERLDLPQLERCLRVVVRALIEQGFLLQQQTLKPLRLPLDY
ncbi:MAG: hypothetical protein KTR25_12075 [Myxococcales bacterium]|nr:hypothetical protein [Myxococcales bacterium]